MKIMNPKSDNYFPQPESNGGWRFLKDADEITDLTSMNLGKLDDVIESYKFFFDTYASFCQIDSLIAGISIDGLGQSSQC